MSNPGHLRRCSNNAPPPHNAGADLRAILAASAHAPPSPWTARLEDESKPDGAVIVEDANGGLVGVMARAVWDAFQSGKVRLV